MSELKPIMFVGTASNVGKSVLAAAFCRIFRQDGHRPAPFKAQNMSLNSYATPEGFEIGRAQAAQAEAAGIPCHTDMNPVLLKPTGNASSQIVLHGKPIGNQTAYEYFQQSDRHALFSEVKDAYNRLSKRFNPIVMEGAGSISELNLKKRDIVNMRMAAHAGAVTILIGDIDRGGIFGSLYGSVMLLSEEERMLIKGIIVNKFRGDSRLFEEGVKIIEDITGIEVLGVVPYLDKINIDEEDSVALDTRPNTAASGKINVAVVRLPRLSNYTDFAILENIEGVHVFYSLDLQELNKADILILPGSKNTIEDLLEIKRLGIDHLVRKTHQQGKGVIGICGGFQMLGTSVEDPLQIESAVGSVAGIGLFPLKTYISEEKKTVQRTFYFQDNKSLVCHGYEIHMGISKTTEAIQPLNFLEDGSTEGCCLNPSCWGTYMHGILDNPAVLQQLLQPFGINIPQGDLKSLKDKEYDKLAAHVRSHVNIDRIYQILKQ